MNDMDYIDGEHWSVLMRRFAKEHGLSVESGWLGYTHEPWWVEFKQGNGKQIGHGTGKYPATALNRAIKDAGGSGLL